MNKIDLLLKKLSAQYDEDFTMEDKVPTEEEFNQMADAVRESSKYIYSDEEFSSVKDQIRELRAATIGLGISIDKPSDNHDIKWFTKFQENNPDQCKYNDRFKLYMQSEKHWSEEMINDLDRNTTEILNRLGDPNNPEEPKRKGLIIGDVQSGKTANYTSVCNKAIDAGYKVIIILAGRTRTLRRQTQKRLESDFVGKRKEDENQKKGEVLTDKTVGVGFYGKTGANVVEAYTSNTKDFSKAIADTTMITINDQMMPKLFVLKKNKSVLTNLAKWLGGDDLEHPRTYDVPMLLIDDEADDASINTKDEYNPTAINSCIRRILRLFSRSTYLAVTATPFANILINPFIEGTSSIDRDLFPDDFIYCLPTPTNYIGSERMFRSEIEPELFVPISPEDVAGAFPFKHKKTQVIDDLPLSLKTAIRYYALTNVIRDLLGDNGSHRSMMINVSRFVDVQNQLKAKVINFWDNHVKLYIKSYSKMGPKALDYPEMLALKEIFEMFKLEHLYGVAWDKIQEHLYESNEKVSIVSVNQKSSDALDYDRYERENNTGLRVIAIGGDCLSRGLTLEGLCVSYFYRNSQMYDTLMQMGRWFGYRQGYEKLTKVWMAEDAISWYTHISESTEALKVDVHTMNRNELTPMEFGYKIFGHPDALIPTAKAKMKAAKADFSYSEVELAGHLIECPRLFDDEKRLKENETLVREFISKIAKYGRNEPKDGNYFIRNVKSDDVAAFVKSFKTMEWSYYFDSASLADYIGENETLWNVVIVRGTHKPTWEMTINGQNYYFHSQKRTSTVRGDGKKSILMVSGTKLKVGTGGCTILGLEEGIEPDDIKNEWVKLPDSICKNGDRYKDIPDDFILHKVKTPLLLIHFLNIPEEDGQGDRYSSLDCKAVALGLGFPALESSNESYTEKKRKGNKIKRIKVYLNVIAQQLAEEEGDDIINEDL